MLSNIVSSVSSDVSMPLADVRPVEKVLLIPVTSDRGLCGAYNTNIIKLTKLEIAEPLFRTTGERKRNDTADRQKRF